MAWTRNTEIPIRRVRSLLSVISNQSFSSAADELALTQPAVSQHIKQLEEQLGTTLLLRQNGIIELTAAGAALLPAFTRLINSHKTLLDQTHSLSQGTTNIVRLASPASFAALYIAPSFSSLLPRYPNHVLDISEIDDQDAFDFIRSGEVDFGFSGIFVPSPGLSFEKLVMDSACGVVSTESPLAQKSSITIDDLLACPFIRFPIGTTANNWLTSLIDGKEHKLNAICEVRQLVTGLQMVAQNIGVTLLPKDAIRACELPGIRALPLEGTSLQRVTGLVHRQTDHLSEFATALIAMIRAVASDRKSN